MFRRDQKRALALAAAVSIAGCFDTSRTPPGDEPDLSSAVPDQSSSDRSADPDSDLDSAPPDAAVADTGPACAVAQVSLTATADAGLIPGGGAGIHYGGASAINIGIADGAGHRSVGLFRFELDAVPLHAVTRLQLTLDYASHDEACNAPCTACDRIEVQGGMQLALMDNDWIESYVTWSHRRKDAPALPDLLWDVAGAQGTDERSAIVAQTDHVPTQPVVFDSAQAGNQAVIGELQSWRDPDGRVSFQVISSGAVFIAKTREPGCKAGLDPPTLVVSYCID